MSRSAQTVTSVSLTPDGGRAVSGSEDKTLKVWDVEIGELLRTLEGHTERVMSVSLTPDGRRAVSGSGDNTLKVWDLETGKVAATFTGEGSVGAVAFAPDGRTIVAGDESGRVHFLTLENAPSLTPPSRAD